MRPPFSSVQPHWNLSLALALLLATAGCSEAVAPVKSFEAQDIQVDAPAPKFDTGHFGSDSAASDSGTPGTDDGSGDGDSAPESDAVAQADSDAEPWTDTGLSDDVADAIGPDSASPDSADAGPGDGGCSGDGDCDDGDPCTQNLCKAGTCTFPGSGACCKTQADCDDANACTVDLCTSSGCTHTPGNCDDGLACTADACDKNTGDCKHKAKAGTCAIEGACFAAGETAVADLCRRCDPTANPTGWTDNDGNACDDGSACTGKDECLAGSCVGTPKLGCCKSDADCASSDPCSTGSCEVASGSCKTSAVSGCCTSGACCDSAALKILPAGSACGAATKSEWSCNGKQVQLRQGAPGCGGGADDCSSDPAKLAWSAWQTIQTCGEQEKCVAPPGGQAVCEPLAPVGCTSAAQCSDANACTDDTCVQGACSHLPKKCPAGLSCEVATCSESTGQCGVKPQAGLCSIGGQCMLDGVKKPGDSCYGCQAAVDPTAWTLLAACKCTAGSCCSAGVVKPLGTACGTATLASEYACSADGKEVQKRIAVAGCSGPGGTCSVSTALRVWLPWQSVQTCSGGDVCEVVDKTLPGSCKAGADPACGQPDSQEAGTSLKTPYDIGSYLDTSLSKSLSFQFGSPSDVDVVRWQLTDGVNSKQPLVSATWSGTAKVEVCAYFACSAGPSGKDCSPLTCPTGSTGVKSTDVSGAVVNGCCLAASSGSLSFTPKAPTGYNSSGQGWLQVSNQAGKCHALAVQVAFGQTLTTPCTPGSSCCEDSGQFSAIGKSCGSVTLASQYKCETGLPGGKMLVRSAVAGCSGSSTSCSTAVSSYAWSDWTTYKTCASTETCSVVSPSLPGSCKPSTVCAPGSTCCTSTGSFAAAGSSCASALATEYQCASNTIQVRKKFGTCLGTAATCSATAATWTTWNNAKACLSPEVCTPGIVASVLPSCQPKPTDLCSGIDAYETTESIVSAFKAATVSDSADPFWLDPKVKLQSSSDVDYLALDIQDSSILTDPRVYISWQATGPVKVCAYYRCKAGAGGQNCAAIVCPSGSTKASLAAVSVTPDNGCCTTAASGIIDYIPDAPNTMDESGTAFFTVANANPGCQEVAVKLASGDNITTACDPGSTCCTAKGSWASAGSACGTPLGTQNRCTTAGGSTQLQERLAMNSCVGGSATCNSATLAWSAWTLKQACVAPEVCASPVPQVPGSCLVPPSGSCGGQCGYKSLTGTCYCDAYCADSGDCCSDFISECGGSCNGSCGLKSATGNCFCDDLCASSGDCCVDKAKMCP